MLYLEGLMRLLFLMLLSLLAFPGLHAMSPRFHEAQTLLAMSLVPTPMAQLLKANLPSVLSGARGISSDKIPSVEDMEAQFLLVLKVSEDRRPPKVLCRELGVLAHMVQLLMDPSTSSGVTPLRAHFENYGDEHLMKMVVNREPFWAVTAPLDPRPKLLEWERTKRDRHRALLECFDMSSGKPIGPWDTLSVPFAQLQLSFSNSVNATANLWIQLYRATGEEWPLKLETGTTPQSP